MSQRTFLSPVIAEDCPTHIVRVPTATPPSARQEVSTAFRLHVREVWDRTMRNGPL